MSQQINPSHSLSVLDQIYSIIDSKIQYHNYQVKQLIQPYQASPTWYDTVTTESPLRLPDTYEFIIHLQIISRSKNRLLRIRRLLCEQNATVCFDLINNEQHLNYSEKEIMEIMGGGY